MSNEAFSVRAAGSGDFEDGVRYSGAAMGIIAPGAIAREVLGDEISFGRLFAYCFRRFGFPNCGSDPYKEIASYTLVTPMKGVFLTVSIKATTSTSLMFGYMMPRSLDHELCAEDRTVVDTFHAQFLAWRQKNGLSLPRDLVKEGDDDGQEQSNGFDYREDMRQFDVLLKQYCADGGLHYEEMPKGPKTIAVLDAIRAALEDLKAPIGVRDCDFSATSDSCDVLDDDEDDDGENAIGATAHPSAGYFIPPDYMEDPKLFVALSEKLIDLGGGNLAHGIATFVAKT